MRDNAWIKLGKIIHLMPGRIRWKFSCTGHPAEKTVIRALQSLRGVISVRVNNTAGSLAVEYDQTQIDQKELSRLILDIEEPKYTNGNSGTDTTGKGDVILSLAILVLGRLMPWDAQRIISLLGAFPLFGRAKNDLFNEGITSHVLESLAVGISIARRDYFAANMTMFMLELGEYLENSIARKSDDMLKKMLHTADDSVWTERSGREILIHASDVRRGDTVIVGTGVIIPVDGTVLSGSATVNEAAMTGESEPVLRERGGRVMSGTHVEEGRLRIYAEHVGDATAAARIAEYVKESLEAKSETQLETSKLADRMVPWVLALAGGTFALTGNTLRSAAVLQADYSCALKLATPVAFKSSMYEAGKCGILVKGASALEKIACADTFVFDKTGTLTEGILNVTDSIVVDGDYTPDDIISLAASVEEHYFHPLAMAVVAASENIGSRHFDHTEVEFIVAHGVVSEIERKRIVVGSRHFLVEHESISMTEHDDIIEALYRQGKTLLFIGYDGKLIGIIGLKDKIRSNAKHTITRLRNLGVKRIVLLTGDYRMKAEELAAELGIDEVYAEMHPEDKINVIQKLTESGAHIAFVGDGVNDAPALAGAGVGIAMEKGADIARVSADIALLEDDVMRVADITLLAKNTMELVRKNYRLTIGVNSTILFGAVTGILTPVTASFLHNGSTLGILFRAHKSGMIRNFLHRSSNRNKSRV